MKVKTANSVYHVDGNKVMLESGTPSAHLPFGEWVEVEAVREIKVGKPLVIYYGDNKVRVTTPVVEIL